MAEARFSALLDTPGGPIGYDLSAPSPFDAQRHALIARLLRVIAWCWVAYVVFLWLIDTALIRLTPQLQPLPPLYYALQACAALLVLGATWSPQVQRRLGQAFLLVAAVCMAVLPLLITALVTPKVAGPILGRNGVLPMRFAPVVLIGVLLVAWHYPWNYALRLNLVIPLLVIVPALPHPPLIVTAIGTAVMQTSGFLTLSTCVSVLMERLRRQHAALGHANSRLRQHAAALESLTISRERNRVARELHDTLAHTLSGLSVQLETTKAYWEIDPQAARALLDKALTATRSGLQETRRALDALRASPLDDVGLRIALCDLLEAAAEMANLQLDLALPEQLPAFEPATEQAIYRIVQEAVANVTHHAEARSLGLHVAHSAGLVVVRIKDDGRGFDAQAAPAHGHFGLAGMVERAALVGGKLAIASAPGAGTLVELVVAINEGAMHESADLR